MIELATRVMLGEKLKDMSYGTGLYKETEMIAVKVPVFSTQKLPDVEMSLGPEMKSTGEVLGVGYTLLEALYKGFIAAGINIPEENGTILATINQYDKAEFLPMALRFAKKGYKFIATEGTAKLLRTEGIKVQEVKKIGEGSTDILELIKSGIIDFVIDIPTKGKDLRTDGFRIRRTAIEASINVYTSLDTVGALLDIMEASIDIDKVEIINLGGSAPHVHR